MDNEIYDIDMGRRFKRMTPELQRKMERVSEAARRGAPTLTPPGLRDVITTVRLTSLEKASLGKAAGEAGLSLTDYILALHEGYLRARKG
mgnify:CR=1 FL=1